MDEMPAEKVFQVITLEKDGDHKLYRVSADKFSEGEHFYTFYENDQPVASFPTENLIGVVEEAALAGKKS